MRKILWKRGRAWLLVLILLCSLIPVLADAAVKRGSTGDDVSAIQKS